MERPSQMQSLYLTTESVGGSEETDEGAHDVRVHGRSPGPQCLTASGACTGSTYSRRLSPTRLHIVLCCLTGCPVQHVQCAIQPASSYLDGNCQSMVRLYMLRTFAGFHLQTACSSLGSWATFSPTLGPPAGGQAGPTQG